MVVDDSMERQERVREGLRIARQRGISLSHLAKQSHCSRTTLSGFLGQTEPGERARQLGSVLLGNVERALLESGVLMPDETEGAETALTERLPKTTVSCDTKCHVCGRWTPGPKQGMVRCGLCGTMLIPPHHFRRETLTKLLDMVMSEQEVAERRALVNLFIEALVPGGLGPEDCRQLIEAKSAREAILTQMLMEPERE